MFVSVLWYSNVSSEVAGGLVGPLGHKRKIVRLTVDLSHMYLVCRGMLQQWTRLGYKIWTAQQKESSRNSFSSMFKKHKIPQCTDIQCCVLKQERNRGG